MSEPTIFLKATEPRTFGTPSEAWAATIEELLRGGSMIHPRKGPALELPGVHTFSVVSPTNMPMAAAGRDFRQAIGVVEGLSLVGQVSIPEIMIDKVAAFRPFVNHSIFAGAYGPRAATAVGRVAELLREHPDTRQAVISLYDSSRDLGHPDQVDVPCTIALQFKLRSGRLDMWAAMRSNDAWLGLPYDLVQFTMIQAALAQHAGVAPGSYTHSAGSMHLYERHLERARRAGYAEPERYFDWPWWGGSGEIGETASRARRILLGQGGQLEGLTGFEQFLGWTLL